jgi:hypothetical protein
MDHAVAAVWDGDAMTRDLRDILNWAVVFPVLGTLVVLLCVVLVRWLVESWRSGRKGDAPHCAKCDYDLTGSSGTICPECGTPIHPNSIVRGEPGRDWPAIVIVGFCLLVVLLVSGAFVVSVVLRGL